MNLFEILASWWGLLSHGLLHLWVRSVIAAQPTPTPGALGDAKTIEDYFKNLFSSGIRPIGYAIALFFFGWAAILFMLPGERHQDNAKAAIYRVVGGLVLILLTEAIIGIFNS